MENNFTKASNFLGKKVKLIFDRPFGTKHPKHDFTYELNYGYVPETISPDGEELDAYYLSEKIPLKEIEGFCIAYAHREDDNDDKLIIVKEGENYLDEEIMKLINFQEQWFKTKVIRN
jgi:inorganic pyrophosphatase